VFTQLLAVIMNSKIKKKCLNEFIFGNNKLVDYLKNSELDRERNFIKLYTKDFSDWLNFYLRSGKKIVNVKTI
jgi:hypothetical protein